MIYEYKKKSIIIVTVLCSLLCLVGVISGILWIVFKKDLFQPFVLFGMLLPLVGSLSNVPVHICIDANDNLIRFTYFFKRNKEKSLYDLKGYYTLPRRSYFQFADDSIILWVFSKKERMQLKVILQSIGKECNF